VRLKTDKLAVTVLGLITLSIDFKLIDKYIVPSEQERTRCILDETEKIEKQSLRDA